MTRDELMQIGHDAGFDTSELTGEVIALLECVAEHAEAKERTARQEAQAMAECLDMLRTDLIAAGVVGPEVAPMFLTEAVLSAVSLERAARIEAQQRLADMQELATKSGLAHRMAVQRCVQAAVADAVAAEREACEERVEDLYEKIETPYLVDIARAIHACDKA